MRLSARQIVGCEQFELGSTWNTKTVPALLVANTRSPAIARLDQLSDPPSLASRCCQARFPSARLIASTIPCMSFAITLSPTTTPSRFDLDLARETILVWNPSHRLNRRDEPAFLLRRAYKPSPSIREDYRTLALPSLDIPKASYRLRINC